MRDYTDLCKLDVEYRFDIKGLKWKYFKARKVKQNRKMKKKDEKKKKHKDKVKMFPCRGGSFAILRGN